MSAERGKGGALRGCPEAASRRESNRGTSGVEGVTPTTPSAGSGAHAGRGAGGWFLFGAGQARPCTSCTWSSSSALSAGAVAGAFGLGRAVANGSARVQARATAGWETGAGGAGGRSEAFVAAGSVRVRCAAPGRSQPAVCTPDLSQPRRPPVAATTPHPPARRRRRRREKRGGRVASVAGGSCGRPGGAGAACGVALAATPRTPLTSVRRDAATAPDAPASGPRRQPLLVEHCQAAALRENC